MKFSELGFAEDEASAVAAKALSNLDNLPVFSEEILEVYGNRPIWDEMRAAGLIRSNDRYENLTTALGNTLADLYVINDGTEVPTTLADKIAGKILRVPDNGRRFLVELSDFVRLNYGFNPEFSRNNTRAMESSGRTDIDVDDLDKELSRVLLIGINFNDISISPDDLNLLEAAGFKTVGDIIVHSQAYLTKELGLSGVTITAIDRWLQSTHKTSFKGLRGNRVAGEALKWKYAAIKARELK